MPKFITMQQASAIYGVSLATLRRYVSDGKVTAYKVGPRMVRFDAEQLERELLTPSSDYIEKI